MKQQRGKRAKKNDVASSLISLGESIARGMIEANKVKIEAKNTNNDNGMLAIVTSLQQSVDIMKESIDKNSVVQNELLSFLQRNK